MSRVREIVQLKQERKARLKASLDTIVGQLKNLGAEKIVVFGSFAEGDIDVQSDLDLLVVMPSTRTGKEWTRLVYERVERNIAADIMVYTEGELEEKLPSSRFLQQVTQKGISVYEKTS